MAKPPPCLCGVAHWRTQPELCGFYVKPAPPVVSHKPQVCATQAPLVVADDTQRGTCKSTDNAAKTGVKTTSVKKPSRKQASVKTTKKTESHPTRKRSIKKIGRPRKPAPAPIRSNTNAAP